jgi:FkbM family methyltransferase
VFPTLRRIHRALGIKYRFDRSRHYVRRFGVRRAWSERRRLWTPGGAEQTLEVPGISHPVVVRAGTADASTFEHVFIWNDYDLRYPDGVETIIDAGANIGLSAVFFANRFPGATIVAIEPEAGNFALLQRNTASYANVVPLHAALWSEDTDLSLSNPDDRVDSYRFGAEGGTQVVRAFSVPSILDRFGMTRTDVLKIDIEGGEAAVFADRPFWVDRVGMFIVELHGEEAERAFHDATARLAGLRYRRGENHIVEVERSS